MSSLSPPKMLRRLRKQGHAPSELRPASWLGAVGALVAERGGGTMRACPTRSASDALTLPGGQHANSRARPAAPHRWKLLIFALLSVADLSLTWWLLTLPDSHVHEGNP